MIFSKIVSVAQKGAKSKRVYAAPISLPGEHYSLSLQDARPLGIFDWAKMRIAENKIDREGGFAEITEAPEFSRK